MTLKELKIIDRNGLFERERWALGETRRLGFEGWNSEIGVTQSGHWIDDSGDPDEAFNDEIQVYLSLPRKKRKPTPEMEATFAFYQENHKAIEARCLVALRALAEDNLHWAKRAYKGEGPNLSTTLADLEAFLEKHNFLSDEGIRRQHSFEGLGILPFPVAGSDTGTTAFCCNFSILSDEHGWGLLFQDDKLVAVGDDAVFTSSESQEELADEARSQQQIWSEKGVKADLHL